MKYLIFLLPIVFLSGCHHTGHPEKLTTSITSITSNPADSGIYEIDYTLQRISPTDQGGDAILAGWKLRPAEFVDVHFWNNAGLVSSSIVPIGIPDSFLNKSSQHATSKIFINPPTGAREVSIVFGKTDISTRRLILPPLVWPTP